MRHGTADYLEPAGDDLTPVRRKIVHVIEESMRSRGYSPSMREIGDAVGLASTSSVSHQLSVLQAKGYLIREAGRPRTMILRLPSQDSADTGAEELPEGVTEVPLVGRIAAGIPVLADQVLEDVVPLPRMLVGNGDGLIMLKVTGDSMIGAAIADGDWVVVRKEADVENGDIVAAMVESEGSADGEATVKTLKKADGHVWLIPHNPAYTPILADNAAIIGKVVSVLRRL
jgi:repressor LexA